VLGVSFHVELFFGSKMACFPFLVMSSGSWVLYIHFVSSFTVEVEERVTLGDGVFAYLNPSIGAACIEVQVDDLRRSTDLHTSQVQSIVLVFDLRDISTAEHLTKRKEADVQQLRQDDQSEAHPPS
jgi:hypothetical protein